MIHIKKFKKTYRLIMVIIALFCKERNLFIEIVINFKQIKKPDKGNVQLKTLNIRLSWQTFSYRSKSLAEANVIPLLKLCH